MIRAAVILAAMAGSGGLLFAQAAPPAPPALAFEAASVKRNTMADFVPGGPRFQGETFTARQMWAAMLISSAYGIPTREIVDGPTWIYEETSTDRFDVVAKAAPGSSREDMQAMLRHLLEDRFALRVRREKREMPVYVLMKVREPAALGPNLRPAVKDCAPRPMCGGYSSLGKASYQGAPWSNVLQAIAASLERRVIDRTGLSGFFDFELTYRLGLSANADDPAVDIFTAVRQQFGLKLESGTAPFEVAVVESVSRPTPD